jgi:flavin-dependent dehydrogenase
LKDQNFLETEICIVGGGPAGASVAHQLSLLGYQVLLVERRAFAKKGVAESLPISILPLLDVLSVRDQVEKSSFLNELPPIMRWRSNDSDLQQTVKPSFQVDRGYFDQILLSQAEKVGAKILRSVNVRKPKFNASSKIWEIPIIDKKNEFLLKAEFLVDASGRHSILSAKKQAYSAVTLALSACWKSSLPLASRIEAGQTEWYWAGALPNHSYNITVFIDKEQFLREKRCSWIDLYKSLLAKSELFPEFLKGELVSEPSFRDATAYFDSNIVDTNYIKVGEASLSLEPLSSQGIALAITSALQASIVVNTLKKHPQDSQLAVDFYVARQQETITRSQKTAASFYQESRYQESLFWKKRSQIKNDKQIFLNISDNNDIIDSSYKICLAHEVKIVNLPTIEGNFIIATPAINHPLLDRPVAYLGNIAIVPLLKYILPMQTVMQIILQWSHFLPVEQCWAIMEWLWKKRIIVAQD